MNVLKMLAFGIAVCLLSGASRADDKVDYAKLIVGKWEVTKADADTVPVGAVVEFTKDGKLKVTGKKDDKEMTIEGTYTVAKNTFTMKLKIGDQEVTKKITITKLTDKEMATKDEDKVVELKRKK